ncbi:MAG: hypothetical protein U0525_06450 [Patescibacteria group bacterium]
MTIGAIVILLLALYAILTLSRNPTQNIKPSKTKTLEGAIVSTYQTIDIAKENGVDLTFARFPIIVYLTDEKQDYYLVKTITNNFNLKKFKNIREEDIGKCITISYDEVMPSSSSDYLKNFSLLTVNSLEINSSASCYKNKYYPPVGDNDAGIKATFKTKFYSALRPSYDIAYDNKIILGWKEASDKGYSDASGLPKNDNEMVNIFVVPANDEIEKQMLTSRFEDKAVSMKGRFMGGYAESTIFYVDEIAF